MTKENLLASFPDNESCAAGLYSNPCCCFSISVERGVLILAVSGLPVGGVFLTLGIVYTSYPTSVSDEDVINEQLRVLVNWTLQTTGTIYILYGCLLIPLSILLILGSIRKHGGFCLIWVVGKNLGLILLLVCLIWTSFQDSGGAVATMYILGIPFVLFPVDLYFLYVVSIYTTILKSVESRSELEDRKSSRRENVTITRSPNVHNSIDSSIAGSTVNFSIRSSTTTMAKSIKTSKKKPVNSNKVDAMTLIDDFK